MKDKNYRSRSGFSNREGIKKSKRTYQTPKTLNKMFLGTFSKKQGLGCGIILFIIIGIFGAIAIGNSGYFHSYITNYGQDPSTKIWSNSGDAATNNGLSLFNTLGNVTGQTNLSAATCNRAAALVTGSCLEFGQNPTNGYVASGPYILATDAGGNTVNSPTDSPPQHDIFFAQTRYWGFYPGRNLPLGHSGTLNFTSATALSGTWTESGPANFQLACSINESTELAIDNNSTHVFVWITNRGSIGCFDYGLLNSAGTITWGTWQTAIISTSQAQDAEMILQGAISGNPATVFLFYACANSCGVGHSQATWNVVASTNAAMTTWTSPTILLGSDTCPNDFQGASSVDTLDGDIVTSYAQFYSSSNPNCSGGSGQPIPGWHARLITMIGSTLTAYAQEEIPSPNGFGPLALWSFLFANTAGQVKGIFQYAVNDFNATFRFIPLFSVRTSGGIDIPGTWSTPSLGTNTIAQLQSKPGIPACPNTDCHENFLECITYSQSLDSYVLEHQVFGSAGPQTQSLNAILLDKNFNYISNTTAISLGTYSYNGSGSCEKYVHDNNNIPLGYIAGSLPGSWKILSTSLVQASRYGLALSKQTIGDLYVAVGKELEFQQNLAILNPTAVSTDDYGFFLTTNNTLPTENLINYHPLDDKNVVLFLGETKNTGSLFTDSLNINRNPGVTTMRSQSTGACDATGNCYASIQFTSANSPDWTNIPYFILNYTGASNTVASTAACQTAFGSNNGAPSCSYLEDHGVAGSNVIIPPFNLQSQSYYIGYWKGATQNGVLDFCTNKNQSAGGCGFEVPQIANSCFSASMEIDYCIPIYTIASNPNNPPSTIDTGGWLGGALKWFINGAVFIFANLINYFSYLEKVFGPIISLVVSALGIVFITVFNALGGLFGDNSLGTQVYQFLSSISSYLSNVSGLAMALIVNIASPGGLLTNALSFFTNFLSGGYSFINVLTNLFGGLASIVPLLNGFWIILLSILNLGMSGANFIIIMMIALLALAALTDWIQDENPINALVAIILAFFLFYVEANGGSTINIIASNPTISANYLTAWNNTKWFVQIFPVLFLLMIVQWASTLDETARFHRQTTVLHNFNSLLNFYRLVTVDIIMAGWWFFDNAYDIIAKGITAIKGKWTPVEIAGTG